MAEGPHHPIARELRAARAYSGHSRDQVGAYIGISGDRLGAWERGQFTRLPAQAMLSAVARFTRVPPGFEFVVAEPPAATPSVAERAHQAVLRLDGTPPTSSETGGAQGEQGGAS